MTRVKALLMAIILVLGALYVWRLETERRGREEQAQREQKLFGTIEERDILNVQVFFENGGFTIDREKGSDGKNWAIAELGGLLAEPGQVESILRLITLLRAENVLIEKEVVDELGDYGFDSPALILAFKTASARHALYFGSRHPASGRRYARVVGEKRLVLVDERFFSGLKRSAFSLWDRRPLRFDARDISSIYAVRADGSALTLRHDRVGSRWHCEAGDTSFVADRPLVERLIGRLADLRAAEVITAPSGDLGLYGLSEPLLTLGMTFVKDVASQAEVASGEEPLQAIIAFFGQGPGERSQAASSSSAGHDEERKSFLRLRGSSVIYRLEGPFLGDLLQMPVHFRNRKPFEGIDPKRLRRVAIDEETGDGGCFCLVREEKMSGSVSWRPEAGCGAEPAAEVGLSAEAQEAFETWLEGVLQFEVLLHVEADANQPKDKDLVEAMFRVRFDLEQPQESVELVIGQPVAEQVIPSAGGMLSSAGGDKEVPHFASYAATGSASVKAIVSASVYRKLREGIAAFRFRGR